MGDGQCHVLLSNIYVGLHAFDLHVSVCKRHKGQNSRVHIKTLDFDLRKTWIWILTLDFEQLRMAGGPLVNAILLRKFTLDLILASIYSEPSNIHQMAN